MKKLFLILLMVVLAGALVFGGCAKPAPAPAPAPKPATPAPVELTIWSAWAPNTYSTDPYMHLWNDRVNEGGKAVNLSIKYIGGPEVFPNKEGIEALRKDLVNMAYCTPVYWVGVVPEGDVMKNSQLLPWEERETGAYDLMDKAHRDRVGVHFLWRIGHQPYFQLYMNVELDKPDLSGLKIRSTPAYDPLIKALGGTTIRTAPPEVYTTLERNIVDGYGWPTVGIPDRKWEEVTKYKWGPAFFASPTGVFINVKTWDSLHEDQRAFLSELSLKMERDSAQMYKDDLAKDKAILDKAGVKQVNFSPADEKYYLDTAYDAAWKAAIAKTPGNAQFRPLMTKK